jgi:uncharacterized Zn finger protein
MTNSNLQASREWWAQRWLELLDSYRFKKRLERARNYARQGNILSIEFKGAKVLAVVQGTEPEPYQVSSLDPFTDEQWGYVIETMSQRAIFAAKLLAGKCRKTLKQFSRLMVCRCFRLHYLISRVDALALIKLIPANTLVLSTIS